MKVAIYNRYLTTAGGGEKHMGAIAEYLSHKKNYQIDILTYEAVDLTAVSKKLNLDLSKCKVRYITNLSSEQITETTKEYDLFINTSYLSTIKPKAKANLILIFFPILKKYWFLAKHKWFQKLIKSILPITKLNLTPTKGFYDSELIHGKTGKWTKKEFSFVVPKLGRKKIEVVVHTIKMGKLKLKYSIKQVQANNENCEFKTTGNNLHITFTPTKKQNHITVTLRKTFTPSSSDSRELGFFVHRIKYAKKNLLSNFIRKLGGIIFVRSKKFASIDYLNSYDLILSNSDYTQRWLKKLWNKNSKILYPEIHVEEFINNTPKSKKIISVGRFFEGNHNKKHLPMIQAFKQMYDDGLKDWEYHLCGGTHREEIHQNYVKNLKKEAQGYPIFIHTDIPFPELKKLYAKASIFWHAAGFEEEEKKNPDKFEHFGITTVEAMASGCIPIVIAKAGQLEIVEDGINGFLWHDLNELTLKTLRTIKETPEKKTSLREKSIKKSYLYDKKHFEQTLEQYIQEVLKKSS